MARRTLYLSMLALAVAAPLAAQEPGPASTTSAADSSQLAPLVAIGLAPRIHPYFGVGGVTSPSAGSPVGAHAVLGGYKDVGNAIIGIRAWGAEAWAGGTHRVEGGGRLLALSPALFMQAGADVNVSTGSVKFVVSMLPPIHRGGIVGRSTALRIDWFPASNALGFGVVVPRRQPWSGRRPVLPSAVALPRAPRPAVADTPPAAALGPAAEAARWITAYFGHRALDGGGFDESRSLADFRLTMAAWRDSIRARDAEYPEGRSWAAVVARYHASLVSAFVAATGDSVTGTCVADAARFALLDEVILPYDRLIGLRKHRGNLFGYAENGRARLGEWMEDSSSLSPIQRQRVLTTFDALVAIADDSRRASGNVGGDDARPAWIPLQLALRPEDHDSQQEIDRLIERAVGEEFSDGNDFSAASAAWFARGLVQSINATRDYHVVWLHDFRGVNGYGKPDIIGFRVAVRGYLSALTKRVNEYDQTGKLPLYLVFLDQFFYETNDGPRWIAMLDDPLRHRPRLDGAPEMSRELDSAQAALRAAVAGSKRLQREAAAHGGDAWLRQVVRVHVNVTTQPDWSVRSGYGMPGFRVVPDHRMRDHRKIVIYDVSERDPNRGAVIFAGTGVGEHYASNVWDDRAMLVHGPVALSAKAAVRRMLAAQGFRVDELPSVLLDAPRPASYDSLVGERIARGSSIAMLSLHNEVGFASKKATLARAVLYTLMPPGSVMYVPDAFWTSSTWAGQLMGAALRGCHVFVIAPSAHNAPFDGVALAREREVVARLVEAQTILADDFASAGGGFRVGLYTRTAPIGDIPKRLREAADGYRRSPFLARAIPFAPMLTARFEAIADSLEKSGTLPPALPSDPESKVPLLHRKTQFFGTGEAIQAIARDPAAMRFLPRLIQTATDANVNADSATAAAAADMGVIHALAAAHAALPSEIRAHSVYYTTIGSMNMDPISARANGEVLTLISGPAAMIGFIDFFQLAGAVTWVESPAELDPLLPRAGKWTRYFAHRFRNVL